VHDLLVIGGGPAGSTCARRAAERGLDVVLIEKEYHPREKPCGGALSPRAKDLLGFEITNAIEREFQAALIYTPAGKQILLTRDGFNAYLVKRNTFDDFLLEKAKRAGVEVIQGSKVVAIEQLRRGVRALSVGDAYKAHLLVGADGVNGITGRQLGIRNGWDSESVALCLNAEFPMDSSDIERAMVTEDNQQTVINLYFGLVAIGYGWCFPKRDSLNIGIGCRMDKAANLRDRWSALVARIESSKKIKLQATKKASARMPLGGAKNRIIARRAMLIGDAAGLVSPISGEGISYAIESGILAADIACKVVAEKSAKCVIEYEQRLKHGVVRELEALRTIARILYGSMANIDIICEIAEKDSVLRGYMTDILTRSRPHSDVVDRMLRRMILHHPLKTIRLGFTNRGVVQGK
jgi:geranylgeranyl reductase family protein